MSKKKRKLKGLFHRKGTYVLQIDSDIGIIEKKISPIGTIWYGTYHKKGMKKSVTKTFRKKGLAVAYVKRMLKK